MIHISEIEAQKAAERLAQMAREDLIATIEGALEDYWDMAEGRQPPPELEVIEAWLHRGREEAQKATELRLRVDALPADVGGGDRRE